MWLLDWLNDRWSRVTTWFGSFFWAGYDRLKNFWSYLEVKAKATYRWVRDDLIPKINTALYSAKQYAAAQVRKARSWTWSLIQSIYNTIDARVSQLWAGINAARTWTWDTVQANYRKARSEYLRIKTNLEVWVRGFVKQRIAPLEWVQSYKTLVEGLSQLFNPEGREKIALLLNNGFNTLLTFWTNPFSFVISLIEPVFIDLLTWTLAYALGTEEAELPPPPSWSDLRAGAGGPAPIIPPDISQGLKAPLNKVWVSGYRYRQGHRGIDLGLSRGDPVYAMHDGIIEYINEAYTGYGFQIVIRGREFWTRYAHLDQINVKRGQGVSAGEMIGRGNSTGNSTGDHLHLEIKYRNQFIDPATVLGLRVGG